MQLTGYSRSSVLRGTAELDDAGLYGRDHVQGQRRGALFTLPQVSRVTPDDPNPQVSPQGPQVSRRVPSGVTGDTLREKLPREPSEKNKNTAVELNSTVVMTVDDLLVEVERASGDVANPGLRGLVLDAGKRDPAYVADKLQEALDRGRDQLRLLATMAAAGELDPPVDCYAPLEVWELVVWEVMESTGNTLADDMGRLRFLLERGVWSHDGELLICAGRSGRPAHAHQSRLRVAPAALRRPAGEAQPNAEVAGARAPGRLV